MQNEQPLQQLQMAKPSASSGKEKAFMWLLKRIFQLTVKFNWASTFGASKLNCDYHSREAAVEKIKVDNSFESLSQMDPAEENT